jgi:hypothetical protein
MESVLALLALLVSAGSLYVALSRSDREVRKAFKRLESDVETMWEKVESHLGRISRLRRGNGVESDQPTKQVLAQLLSQLHQGGKPGKAAGAEMDHQAPVAKPGEWDPDVVRTMR